MRPARMWAIAAVAAAAAEMSRFAPVPAAAEPATSSVAGRRMLPSTRPTRPPARATRKHHRQKRASSIGAGGQDRRMDQLFDANPDPAHPPERPPNPPGAPPLAAR